MCEADDKSLIPIYQAAYEEGKRLRISQELRLVDALLTGLESAQYGNETALRRSGTRSAEREKKQN